MPVHENVPLPVLIEPEAPNITLAAFMIKLLLDVLSVELIVSGPVVSMTVVWKVVSGLSSVMPPLPATSSNVVPEFDERLIGLALS